jgi:RNA polymerase sigma-70 factor (ECF subfamily)
MSREPEHDEFCGKLVDAQRGLYAYIVRLLPNVTDANDVLQKTKVVILSKRNDFRVEADFNAWAAGIARHQVLAFRRDARRDRLVFRDQLLDQLADRGIAQIGRANITFEAMELCRGKLSEADRELLDYRYTDNLAVADIAENLGRSPHAVSQSLYRIRVTLLECIQQVLSSEEDGDARRPSP